MKKTSALFIALIAMSMVFVSCVSDEPRGGKSYEDYVEFLLGLPVGESEDGNKLYLKQVDYLEDMNGFEVVTVLTLTFKNDICEKAICDYVYPSESLAKIAYEMWLLSWEEMSDVDNTSASYEKCLFTIDFSKTPGLFVGLTREEIRNSQGIL
ncbi:MAG: hypothetical protein IKY75_03475 [Bacteroidaceae bacterium]|nr:hypothetical protein [Bacteroidaceae bacterium]